MGYHNDEKIKGLQSIEEILSDMPRFVTLYVRAIQNKTTVSTQIAYLTDIRNFLDYCADAFDKETKSLAPDDLNACDREFFDDYLNYLRHYRKDGKEYTNDVPSLKRKLSSVRNFMTYLYNEEYIKDNAITKVHNPKLRKKQVVRLNKQETNLFLSKVEYGGEYSNHKEAYHQKQKCRDLALTSLLLSTGIRVSECVGIDINDVNLETSAVRIMRKGEKQDIVYFSDECSAFLCEYLEERANITPLEGHENALFLSSQKRRITVRAVEKLVKKYASEATPLKHITPHKLRASFGTRLYEESGDIYLVSQALGHNSVDTSSKYYIDASDTKKMQSRNLVSLLEQSENSI